MSSIQSLKESSRRFGATSSRLIDEIAHTFGEDPIGTGRKMSLQHFVQQAESALARLKQELEYLPAVYKE